MANLSGLGGLTEGFMRGADFASDLQYKRKRKRALEYGLAQMGREEQAAAANAGDVTDEERAFYGDQTALPANPEFDGDPFLFKLTDWASKKFGRKNRRALKGGPSGETSAPVDEAALMAPGTESMPVPADGAQTFALPDEPQAYADGGEVDDEETRKIKERAAQNRTRNPGRVERATETVEGADRTVKRTKALGDVAEKAPKRAGFLRGAAGGGAAAAGIGGALQSAGTPTSDYYTRLGLNPRDAGLSFWKDTGVRALGTMTDVGASAAGMVGINLRDSFKDERLKQAQPTTATAAPQRQAALQDFQPSPAAAPAPQAPQGPQPGDAIDLSNLDIDSSELPNLNVNDWKRVRAQALRTARLKGLPQGEALQAADQMVTQMQIRGFTNYAAQAQALMQAQNLKGAARALRAAYQYFPDGNDVKIGIQNGHLIAVGVDDETGQPFEKGTHVITPEFLSGAIQNFANPTAFQSWTKDWRTEQFAHQKYNEVEKPLAQAQASALTTTADANMQRAQNAAMGGGLKPQDMRGAQQFFVQRLQLMGVTDPQQADQLAATMAQIKAANPQVPEMMIIDFVMKASQRPDAQQFIQQALSGQ